MLLNNRYKIIRTLGSGGFGETFLAEDTQMPSQRCCVIKQLKPIEHNPQVYQLVQERFQREAAILEELGCTSDRIPTLYAYFQLDGQFYLVQEWVEGDTLTSRIRQQGLLSEGTVREILASLLPVLDYVHSKRIVHRDIKPDNIILRHRDGQPVLIDFGAVRESMGTIFNSQGSPTSSIVIGTPGFMPSEQAAGRPVYSSDLYSLGITAIYLLTGKQPQELETNPYTGEIVWEQYAVNISPPFKAVIDKAIQYHPRDRFYTAEDMLAALQGRGNAIPTQPPSNQLTVPPETVNYGTPPVGKDKAGNNFPLKGVIGGGLIAISVIVGLVLWKSPPPQIESESTTSKSTPTATPNSRESFYFVADSAFSDSENANQKVENLKAAGYPQAGMFWIPDYANLSGKQLFSVYPAKFSDRNSCINFLKIYGQVNSQTYCAVASTDGSKSPERLYFQDISPTSDDYTWLSQRRVTDADLEGKDGLQLDIMRNSIFARKGRRFVTPGLQQYFNNQPWYRPRYSPQEFPNNLLSDLEMSNVEYINNYQERYNRRYFR